MYPEKNENTNLKKSMHQCFPGVSDGKESAYNAGDLGLVLGWEDPLEEGTATR